MGDCDELMPRYLPFVKGLLEAESMLLNASREIGIRILDLAEASARHRLAAGTQRPRRRAALVEAFELLYDTTLLTEGDMPDVPTKLASMLADRLARTLWTLVTSCSSPGQWRRALPGAAHSTHVAPRARTRSVSTLNTSRSLSSLSRRGRRTNSPTGPISRCCGEVSYLQSAQAPNGPILVEEGFSDGPHEASRKLGCHDRSVPARCRLPRRRRRHGSATERNSDAGVFERRRKALEMSNIRCAKQIGS